MVSKFYFFPFEFTFITFLSELSLKTRKSALFKCRFPCFWKCWNALRYDYVKFQSNLSTYDTQMACLKLPCFGEIWHREKGNINVSYCVYTYGSFCNRWSLTLLNDGRTQSQLIWSWGICYHLKWPYIHKITPSATLISRSNSKDYYPV